MRRFGCKIHYFASQSLRSRLHSAKLSPTQKSLNSLGIGSNVLHKLGRQLNTQDAYGMPSTEKIVNERKDAKYAEPVPIPALRAASKRLRPVRVSDLYDALVYEGNSKKISEPWRRAMAMKKDGSMIDVSLNERLKGRLEHCRAISHAEEAFGVLDEIKSNGLVPSARAVVMVIEACIPAEEFTLAENALRQLPSATVDHPAFSQRLICSARTLLAITFSTRAEYKDALRIMQFGEYQDMDEKDGARLCRNLERMRLGTDTLAWGVVVKSLTKLGRPRLAVSVVNTAMGNGVGMTDSLLHLTIDALRALDEWKKADWLFNSAVTKGVVPKERTLASVLLALTSKQARRSVEASRIEEIIDMAPDPSPRFLLTALMALGSVGAVERGLEVFQQLGKHEPSGIPSETAFLSMMGCFANYIELGLDDAAWGDNLPKIFTNINEQADNLWHSYNESYKDKFPSGAYKEMRGSFLSRYLWAKTRCQRITESVDVLEEVAYNPGEWPWFKVENYHATTVLGAIELSCDTVQMRRVLKIMGRAGLEHDTRSLAFCVGTYLGDGNVSDALAMVRAEGQKVLTNDALGSAVRFYHPKMLRRRLDMLAHAMRDAGLCVADDIEGMMRTIDQNTSRSR